MSRFLVLLTILALICVSAQGCFLCPEKIDGDRLQQVNQEWWLIYNSQRRMTKAEASEYEGLTDEQKIEWRKEGKPTDRPLLDEQLDAVKDLKDSIDKEAEAAK
jgi:hypothetical protein